MNKQLLFFVIATLLSITFVNASATSYDWAFQSKTWLHRTLDEAVDYFVVTTDYSNTLPENKWMNYYVDFNFTYSNATPLMNCTNYTYYGKPRNITITTAIPNCTGNTSVDCIIVNVTWENNSITETKCVQNKIENSALSYVPGANGTKRLSNLNVVQYSAFKRIVMPDYRSNMQPFINVTPKIIMSQVIRLQEQEAQDKMYPRIMSYERGSAYCRRASIMVNYGDNNIAPFYYGNCLPLGERYNSIPSWVSGKYYNNATWLLSGYNAQVQYLWDKRKEAMK